MEKLNQKITDFLDMYKEIQKEREDMMKAQSEVDKELSELYHEVEGTRFKHVCQSHKMLMKLQDTLNRRRNIKGKVAVLLAFTDFLTPHIKSATNSFKTAKKKHDDILAQLLSEAEKRSQASQAEASEPASDGQLKINLFETENKS